MKKLLMLAVVGILAIPTVKAQTTSTVWNAAINATQTAKAVRLDQLTVQTLPTGKVFVIVRWSWLDETGKPIRNGVSRFTEDEIAVKIASKGADIAQIRQLFMSIAQEEAAK